MPGATFAEFARQSTVAGSAGVDLDARGETLDVAAFARVARARRGGAALPRTAAIAVSSPRSCSPAAGRRMRAQSEARSSAYSSAVRSRSAATYRSSSIRPGRRKGSESTSEFRSRETQVDWRSIRRRRTPKGGRAKRSPAVDAHRSITGTAIVRAGSTGSSGHAVRDRRSARPVERARRRARQGRHRSPVEVYDARGTSSRSIDRRRVAARALIPGRQAVRTSRGCPRATRW